MKLAYGVTKMKSTASKGGAACVLWAYDLDKPREQREGLPQGTVVDMVGVYKNVTEAKEAAQRHRVKFGMSAEP